MAMEKGPLQCCGICACVLFITTIILFALSFDTVDVCEMGIKYNNNLVMIDDETVYNNGRYFLGLGLSFIIFPTKLIPIEFIGISQLRAWSHEGQLVSLDLGFYYALDRSNIIDIYKKYGENYELRFTQYAVKAIKEVTIQYEAEEFFLIRRQIGDHMLAQLRATYREENLSVELFALREIKIPSNFEQKVISKVVEKQKYYTELRQREIALATAAITVLQGQGAARIALVKAEATALAKVTIANADADGQKLVYVQEASSYKNLSSSLGLSSEQLLNYQFAKFMGNVDSKRPTPSSFMLGFKGPLLQVQGATPIAPVG